MAEQKRFTVLRLQDLRWPASLQLPNSRFRLFVAADSRGSSTDAISEFLLATLRQGMVYCCTWGPGCERLHDILDEIVVDDSLSERRFVGPTRADVIMTTWHSGESLEQALEFFTTCALPTEGFLSDSDFGWPRV